MVRAARSGRQPRRTQAERSAATRQRILRAVVDTIAEVGFTRATSMEIAHRAGVTWGAVQHHFGGKDGMLDAVLEDTFSRFASRFEDFPAGLPLRGRVRALLERAWAHFSSPHFRTTFEILLHHLPGRDAFGAGSPQRRMVEALDRLWMRVFGELPVSETERLALQRYLVAVLSGLALQQVLAGRPLPPPREELRLLEDVLVRRLHLDARSAAAKRLAAASRPRKE